MRKVASMSQGGITEDFTDSVGSEIKYIVESIAKSTHAFALGVDERDFLYIFLFA